MKNSQQILIIDIIYNLHEHGLPALKYGCNKAVVTGLFSFHGDDGGVFIVAVENNALLHEEAMISKEVCNFKTLIRHQTPKINTLYNLYIQIICM